jgi:conjugative transposon TraN protein
MKDFIHDGSAVNRPNNSMEVFLRELGDQSPTMVHLIMRTIYANDKRFVKHIGSKRFGIQYLLKGVYSHQNMIYFHTQTRNLSNVPYDIDFIRFKIVDKKIARRTAIQETVIVPVRAFNYVTNVAGRRKEMTVLAFDKFTIPDDKLLVVEMYEKNGGRHQKFYVENADLVRARTIEKLKMKQP